MDPLVYHRRDRVVDLASEHVVLGLVTATGVGHDPEMMHQGVLDDIFWLNNMKSIIGSVYGYPGSYCKGCRKKEPQL
jgi:hypothetical protein